MDQTQQPNREPGIKCPRCGAFIRTSVEELLMARSLWCTECRLELKLDRRASGQALNALQKVQDARLKVNKASKFNR